MTPIAIICFAAIVASTLGITWWAARRTHSTSDFYAAGGRITGLQNGLALAGDSLSAGAFLGLTGLVFASGFDGFAYAVGYSTGMPVVVFLLAERLRRLGRFTFTDVTCLRLDERPMRIFGAMASLVVVSFYLIAQMVGAGQLIQLLFSLDYAVAVSLVGILMVCYVLFGGMTATTWVQIVKAILMLCIGAAMVTLILARFGCSFPSLLSTTATQPGRSIAMLSPHAASVSPLSAISLGLALMFGTCGLPHILMRFFTVPDVYAARTSVFWGTGFISSFYAAIAVLGFGAIALLSGEPSAVDGRGQVVGGGNMAAIHLARLLGGEPLFGVVSAVAFATILAVVAGLTLAGASAVSHDLYARVVRHGTSTDAQELRVSRVTTLVLGALAIALGIAFRTQNVAYMISLAFAIAASSTFPVLLLSLYWPGLTTRGAIIGGCTGLVSALLLTAAGPLVWVKVLGFAMPLSALDPPTLITMPLAFSVCWLVSFLDVATRNDVRRDAQ